MQLKRSMINISHRRRIICGVPCLPDWQASGHRKREKGSVFKPQTSIHITAIISIMVLGLLACSNPRYINSPSVHNAAFLKKQGDFKLSVAGTGNPSSILEEDDNSKKSLGFDGQAAVAITNHFMITAGGMYRSERDHYRNDDLFSNVSNSINVEYTRNMFDIGLGFFTPIGHSSKVYFNGVFGVGLGKIQSSETASPFDGLRSRSFDADVLKYNIHPSFNFFFNNYLRMSIAPRFSVLKLNNIKTTYTLEEEYKLGYYDTRKHAFGVFEPAVLLQAGFRNNDWLKLDFGFNFSTDPFTTKSSEYDDRPYAKLYNVQSRNFLVSIGLSFYPMGNRR